MSSELNRHTISVIIPAYNNADILHKSLDALVDSTYGKFEIIVVDDCSTDKTVSDMVTNILLIKLSKRAGPAAARNIGAERALGDILFFIDSDVLVSADTIEKVNDFFSEHSDVHAVFGSYDDAPSEANFFSQYRNLFHHFHHQISNTRASTFWSGCGAIRKDVFFESGTFNQSRYKTPSIEDIDLGYRIIDKGYTIELKKDLLVKHMKRWDFFSILQTDIFQRAVPWSRLILETKSMPRDLNLKISHRISSFLVLCIVVLVPLCLILKDFSYAELSIGKYMSALIFFLIIAVILLNLSLYTFFYRKRGILFALATLPLHFLYYFYSGAAFGVCYILYKTGLISGRPND